jgi:peptidoglycan LD-endopeptidase LytH
VIARTIAIAALALLAGCDRDDNADEWHLPDSQPMAAAPNVIPAKPPPVMVAADSGTDATKLELDQLAGALAVPVQGVTRDQLRDSYTEARSGHLHDAMDIAAVRGTPVLAATDGRLLKLFDSKAGGLMVYATDASQRFILLYGHLDGYADGLTNGMPLKRGQTIGYVGTSGNAPPGTPHLHFGILRGNPDVSWSKGVAVNPYLLYVPGKAPLL